ncbi:MAG TPA: sigma-70 family RNA polymerase sigma factor [Ohtaekwangia sp.]
MSSFGEEKPLVEHLFRHEAGKLIAVLTKMFGPHNLELAEDVVQDTLIKALENWRINGIPQNPTAWLFTAARNKALDVVRRERYKKEFAAEISPLLKSEFSAGETIRQLVHENEIEDEQLRMMFVCCHPSMPEESQVALILKTLCGFSVAEIAKAFLTGEETITKRLYRARQQFREEKIAFTLPDVNDLPGRLQNVLMAIYLIFNEGYNSTHHTLVIREDLVEESLRLANLIIRHPHTNKPESLALTALLCFHAARLYGRVDREGNLVLLKHQDRSQWNYELIRQGNTFLKQASGGEYVSAFHVEAAIAYEHCIAASYAETNWKQILELYDILWQIRPDGIVALNRLIASAEVNGVRSSLKALLLLQGDPILKDYYLYYATLGDWHAQLGEKDSAKNYFTEAVHRTESPGEKKLLQQKINAL